MGAAVPPMVRNAPHRDGDNAVLVYEYEYLVESTRREEESRRLTINLNS